MMVTIESLFFITIVLVHGMIFYGSDHPHRFRRLLQSCIVFLVSVPLMFLGVFLGLGADEFWESVSRLLIYSPLLLAVLSFIVHLRPDREHGSKSLRPRSH